MKGKVLSYLGGRNMNAMDSIFLPRFTIGENAFDAFHDEMGRYGKK